MHVIYVTCSADESKELARQLVEEHLVACVSILPGIESTYRWEGVVEQSSEVLLLMETSDDRVDAAMARIEDIHSYEVPKIVAFEGARVSTVYAQWVTAETKSN